MRAGETYQFDSYVLASTNVVTQINVPERSTADLLPEAVLASNSQFHITRAGKPPKHTGLGSAQHRFTHSRVAVLCIHALPETNEGNQSMKNRSSLELVVESYICTRTLYMYRYGSCLYICTALSPREACA